jgi:hypothetical protein
MYKSYQTWEMLSSHCVLHPTFPWRFIRTRGAMAILKFFVINSVH